MGGWEKLWLKSDFPKKDSQIHLELMRQSRKQMSVVSVAEPGSIWDMLSGMPCPHRRALAAFLP